LELEGEYNVDDTNKPIGAGVNIGTRRQIMGEIQWNRYPQVATNEWACSWLTMQNNLGLASATIDAYGRALQDYLTFCCQQNMVRILVKTITQSGPCRSGIPGMAIRQAGDNTG
jgi:hypothetical protein